MKVQIIAYKTAVTILTVTGIIWFVKGAIADSWAQLLGLAVLSFGIGLIVGSIK